MAEVFLEEMLTCVGVNHLPPDDTFIAIWQTAPPSREGFEFLRQSPLSRFDVLWVMARRAHRFQLPIDFRSLVLSAMSCGCTLSGDVRVDTGAHVVKTFNPLMLCSKE